MASLVSRRAGEEHRTQSHQRDDAMAVDEARGIKRIGGEQDLRIVGDVHNAGSGDGHEPDERDGSEEICDACRAAGLIFVVRES